MAGAEASEDRGADGAEPERERFDAQRHYLASQSEPRSVGSIPGLIAGGMDLVRRASPRLFVVVVVSQLLTAVLLGAQVLLGKEALQAIIDQSHGGGSLDDAVPALLGLVVVTSLSGLISGGQLHLQRFLGEKVQKLSMEEIIDVTTTVDLLEFESPGFFDDLQRVKVNAIMRPLNLVTGLTQIIGGSLAVGAVIIALLLMQPLLLPILLLGALPMWLLSRRSGRSEFRFTIDQTPARRVRTYLEEVLSERSEAKEVRSFDLGQPLRERWEQSYVRYFGDLERHVRHRLALALATAGISAVAMAATLCLLTWLIVEGHLSLATAGAALIAVRLLGTRVQQLSTGVGSLFESALFMRDLSLFLQRRPPPAADDTRPPAGPVYELRAEGVTFRYPESERDVLKDVSVTLREGEVIALVGENGSGKTTLAKLLAVMFSPTEGRVLWNGIDARELLPSSMRPQIGVIFQDFVRYELTARENVGFGRHEVVDDMDRIVDAARRGGIDGHLSALPEGYETGLGKEFLGGYDLSGGQWQRVALARAFFRDAEVLVLDEPTAALDARSEHEVFERVKELAHGRTLLLISHRFSTVRSADRIYVLEEGRVIEEGPHDDLIAAGGKYAELFELQASAYR